MKVGVAGTNPANAVFAHKNCGMGVMEQVAGQMRKFCEDLSGHLGMS